MLTIIAALAGLAAGIVLCRRTHRPAPPLPVPDTVRATIELGPHFLFNALNTVSSLITRDSKEANALLVDLSDLLRKVYEQPLALVSLDQEVETLFLYARIEQCRFGERLRITTDIDPVTTGMMLPSFILQPLVETAVRNSVETRRAGGTVVLRTRARDGTLEIQVDDDGQSVSASPELAERRALSQIRARLGRVYPNSAWDLRAEESPEGGSRLIVQVPQS